MRAKTPLGPMLRTSTLAATAPFKATYSCVLAQLQSMLAAPGSAKGGPAGVSAPVAAMLNIDMFPGADVTARNFPSDVTLAFTSGPAAPLGNGDPGTGLRPPFAAMLKTVIVKDDPFVAIRNLSSGVAVSDSPIPSATPPVGNGEPGTAVRTPLTGLIEKALMVSLPALPA